MRRKYKIPIFLILGLLSFSSHDPARADTPPGLIRETLTEHEKAMAAEGQAQKTRESWAEERGRLLSRLEALEREHQDLERQKNRQLRARNHLSGEVTEIRRELAEAQRLEKDLDGRLESLVQRLEGAVAFDLPFLKEERSQRLSMLKGLLVDPDAPPAERLRRVLEALRIEADYGFTTEVRREILQTDQGEVTAQVLRVGRLALFYRTEDGRTGQYDPAEGRWIRLEQSWEGPMARTLDVATRRRAPELVVLPLGRIAP
ncbi:DUF3450 domain-containing protein [Desulfobotulus sp.]|jgi:hypothetical protein|uniref:DUF3450 domain-containing protein n=1 Tax=Desulfobotulus sp. TaxID=1940337 RepID=UPI002A36B591|nr:DUF3450 domain-containing protein [Desulfobotulus sp.]MDY0163238.1 DUF3450 domain-containing protein [Desulfobotulus sp.]